MVFFCKPMVSSRVETLPTWTVNPLLGIIPALESDTDYPPLPFPLTNFTVNKKSGRQNFMFIYLFCV